MDNLHEHRLGELARLIRQREQELVPLQQAQDDYKARERAAYKRSITPGPRGGKPPKKEYVEVPLDNTMKLVEGHTVLRGLMEAWEVVEGSPWNESGDRY